MSRAVPTEDELAAILAAVELLWPRPADVAAPRRTATPAWRFSGRWWRRRPGAEQGRRAPWS